MTLPLRVSANTDTSTCSPKDKAHIMRIYSKSTCRLPFLQPNTNTTTRSIFNPSTRPIYHTCVNMKITTIIIAALSTAALASESQFEFSHSCNTCFQMWNECMAVSPPLPTRTYPVADMSYRTNALRSNSTKNARSSAKLGCAIQAQLANGVKSGVATTTS